MKNTLTSLLAEPRVGNPPVRVWRDWLVLVALIVSAVVEGFVRDSVSLPVVASVVTVGLTVTVLWRRVYPLGMLMVGLGGFCAFNLIVWIIEGRVFDIYSSAFVLLLVYPVFRWGSGRDIAGGTAVLLAAFVFSLVTNYTGIGDAIGGLIVLFSPVELGLGVRGWMARQQQKIEQVKAAERVQLARELHDTVAHHLSAITIQAQAGRVLMKASSTEGVSEALGIIEEEASRSLAEMRSMIDVLRSDVTQPVIEAQFGVADLDRLTQPKLPGAPRIKIHRSGDLEQLRPSVQATLFRLAQESVTNAVRHSRNATQVEVAVHGGVDVVRLSVTDDGDGTVESANPAGYGLVGMGERTALLGGTFYAGPQPARGWLVEAVIPR